ncbi:hypothetical protein R2Q81_07100 [Microbacterium aquimaris]|uniref:hypothetical protein n=1 Tax=Microbacterium aquimaris TaxID=459816 RepID=UPI002AD2843C|nr:hypothetical protein [Microbacterium aquimaris]MDZ8275716.1 hypothetical protein [Microbacterium aquimaris]
MNNDIEYNVGLVAITMRSQDVDFRGVPVSAGRAGGEQDGKLREAVIESSDGLRMTIGCTVWEDGSADVQPLDFLAGPDAYRRLEAAGRMALNESGAGMRVALLRALKYGDRGYPSLASVTWDELSDLAGADAAELLSAHGARVGVYEELRQKPRQYREHPAFAVSEDGLEAVFAAFAITRVLPIMKGFGRDGGVEALH